MTEKRFMLIDGVKKGTHSGIWDNQKQHNRGIGDELWVGEIVELLNALNDENKKLKNKLQTYKTTNSLLKATMDRHRTENQQIRDTIKEMYNNERTELGKSTLKQLLEAIQ